MFFIENIVQICMKIKFGYLKFFRLIYEIYFLYIQKIVFSFLVRDFIFILIVVYVVDMWIDVQVSMFR